MGPTEVFPEVGEGVGAPSVGGEHEMVANSKYSARVFIKSILGRPDGGVGLIGQKVTVGGWVKTGRVMGKTTSAFLEVNDGSCIHNLQVSRWEEERKKERKIPFIFIFLCFVFFCESFDDFFDLVCFGVSPNLFAPTWT